MVPEPARIAKNANRSPEGVTMMFPLDLDRVRANVRAASTEDLLDRATVYRSGMEPEALEIIEEELRRRGVTAAGQIDHAAQHLDVIVDASGLPRRCARCPRPAVWCGWGWHRLWDKLPVVPRRLALCAKHAGIHRPQPPRQEQPPATAGREPGRDQGIRPAGQDIAAAQDDSAGKADRDGPRF